MLAAEIRRRLGPPPELSEWPAVSIVVLNRDGAEHLRRLLAGLTERTDYPDLELILVDNASSDDSLDFIRTVEAPFPISILANVFNESFSDGCNQGAEIAAGELLLFLNNDVEPFEPGWLRELVACLVESGAGAAGATLIEPDPAAPGGFSIHQRGLVGRLVDGVPATGFRDRGADPLGPTLGADVEAAAVAAACLLIGRRAFDAVGGFSHGYMYGPEDVDLALKLRAAAMRIVCSGRAVVVHRTGSSLKAIDAELRREWVRGNRRLFLERWGPLVRRELEPGSAAEELGFCLRGGDPRPGAEDAGAREPLEALAEALRRCGRRTLLLWGAEVDELRGLDHDVAVYLRGRARFVPKPGQLNVLWVANEGEAPGPIERARYDLVLNRPPGRAPRQLDGLAGDLIAAVEAHAAEGALPRPFSAPTPEPARIE